MVPYHGMPFTVVTDHQSLTWLAKLNETSPRLARWILALSEYDFKISYRPGKTHNNADGLSRLPLPNARGELEEYQPISYDEVISPELSLGVRAITRRGRKGVDTVDSRVEEPPPRRSHRLRRHPAYLHERINPSYVQDYILGAQPLDEIVRSMEMPPCLDGLTSVGAFKTNNTEGNIQTNVDEPCEQGLCEEPASEMRPSQPKQKKAKINEKNNSSPILISNPIEKINPYVVNSNNGPPILISNPIEKINPYGVNPNKTFTRVGFESNLEKIGQHVDEHDVEEDISQANNEAYVPGAHCKTPEDIVIKSGSDSESSKGPEIISEPFTLVELAVEQDVNPYYRGMKDFLLHGELPSDPALLNTIRLAAPDFEVVLNSLYYWPAKRRNVLEKRLVVQTKHRQRLIHMFHDEVFGGHLGGEKTYQKMYPHYYWERMYAETIDHCVSCLACQLTKVPHRQKHIVKHKVKRHEGYPWKRVYTDFVGPVIRSSAGDRKDLRYIIVFVDEFSGWCETKAVTDCTAETVVDTFIELIVCRYGAPEEFVTDNGSHFDNKLVTEITAVLDTKKLFTSVYHPQANGQCERLNGTLCKILRTFVSNNPIKWAQYLPYIMYAYRTTYQKAIRSTPFQMIYGRKPILPATAQLHSLKEEDIETYTKNLKLALQQIHDEARKVMKEAYDAHYGQPLPKTVKEFQEGDLVLVRVHKPEKFRARYEGPFRVARRLQNDAYQIERPDKDRKSETINVQHLKHYISRTDLVRQIK